MSRGFHAFFRQYYNLRSLLRRSDPALERLRAIEDYPLISADGMTDSFARIPRTPPFSFASFVALSPSFTAASLAKVDVSTALELLSVRFPDTFAAYDGESAEAFLDRLRFPPAARHLALEVFARSFFAHPSEFSAGELVAMFHTYFLGLGRGSALRRPHRRLRRVPVGPARSSPARAGRGGQDGGERRAPDLPGGWRRGTAL